MADRRCRSDIDLERKSRPVQSDDSSAPLQLVEQQHRLRRFDLYPLRISTSHCGCSTSCSVQEPAVHPSRAPAVAGSSWLWCWRRWSKEERHRAVRRIGTAFAVVQLGTIFAASRALRADRKRQRRVVLDLR